eukprot:scaffold238314_cov24-Tisochrysis_lutea.AAC.1
MAVEAYPDFWQENFAVVLPLFWSSCKFVTAAKPLLHQVVGNGKLRLQHHASYSPRESLMEEERVKGSSPPAVQGVPVPNLGGQ